MELLILETQLPETAKERTALLVEALAQDGTMPIGNGYRFVIDQEPDDRVGTYIPADEFTGYFSRREIPVAPRSSSHHSHDIDHAPDYMSMFADERFADMVQTAALNSLSDPETCRSFTRAMDRFGDKVLAITNPYDAVQLRTIHSAKEYLEQLLQLSGITDETNTPDEVEQAIDDHSGWLNLRQREAEARQRAQQAFGAVAGQATVITD
jgi:hypothetical protein